MPGEPIIDCHVHPDPVDLPSGLLAEGAPAEVVRSAGVANLEEAFLALARRGEARP